MRPRADEWVGTRYSTLQAPTQPYTTPGTPLPPACRFRTVQLPRGVSTQTKTCRGALIRRLTHFETGLVAHGWVDRGL